MVFIVAVAVPPPWLKREEFQYAAVQWLLSSESRYGLVSDDRAVKLIRGFFLHAIYFHDRIVQIVDHLNGISAALWFSEGAEGVAVEGDLGFGVDLWLECAL